MIVRDLLKALLTDGSTSLNTFVLINNRPIDSVECKDGTMLLTQRPQINERKAVEGEPPARFRFNADITFEAHDVNEAFERLSHHFNPLTIESPLNYSGIMQLQPDPQSEPSVKRLTKKQLKKLKKRFKRSIKAP